MSRVVINPVLCLSLAVGAAACSRDRDNSQAFKDSAARALPDKEQVEVTGCVTANAETNQFVLTANQNALTSLTNRAGAGEAETFHYQLVGGTNLQEYVGKEVRVKGSIDGDGADVDMKTKEKTVEPKRRGDDVTPAIESTQEIELQVEQLNVASITATGSSCPR